MKFSSRLFACALLTMAFASCSTWHAFQNSAPYRLLDELGTEAMSMISDNGGPVNTLPARAQQVQNRGVYAGRVPAVQAPRQSMAAR